MKRTLAIFLAAAFLASPALPAGANACYAACYKEYKGGQGYYGCLDRCEASRDKAGDS